MKLIHVFFALLLLAPLGLRADDGLPLPSHTGWYVHANLAAMRAASDEQKLYGWFCRNIIDDLEEEFGQGSVTGFDAVTVFSRTTDRGGFGLVLHGGLDADRRQQLIEQLSLRLLEDREGHEVYEIAPLSIPAVELEKALGSTGVFLAFGDRGQTLLTTGEDVLAEFLAAGAQFEGDFSPDLLVIRAADTLMRGGIDTASMSGMGGSYESQVFRNIEQAGVALADIGGRYELRVEMVAVSAEKAQALSGIVQGLIGLHAMSEGDADLEFLGTLQSSAEDNRLKLDMQMTPDQLMELLD